MDRDMDQRLEGHPRRPRLPGRCRHRPQDRPVRPWRGRGPDHAFEDADGKPKKLSDWRGKTVLVNLWATWCVPCRKEMPALEGLQTRLQGPNFEVVAINIDTRDPEKPKNFLKEASLTRLGFFSDEKAKVFQDLKSIGRALGMPTSVLVDGQGCEIATIAGPAEWDSDDAVKLITAATTPPS
jgi:thiol-disulfide isomerase/thioredoxin